MAQTRKRSFRSNKRRIQSVRRRRAATRAVRPSRAFTKKVQKIIHKDTETKSECTTNNSLARDAAISVIGDAIYAIPSIAVGDLENQRTGGEIRAQKLVMKGHIALNLNYQSQAACRVGVRVMVVQPKMYPTMDAASTNFASWMPYLLKRGNTEVGFTGSIESLYSDINTNVVTKMYDKVFYLSVPAILNYAGVTDVDNYITSDNRQSIKFFSKTFNLRNKLLKFSSGVSTDLYPTNYAPMILVGFARLDGSAITADTQVLFNNVNTLFYEDL